MPFTSKICRCALDTTSLCIKSRLLHCRLACAWCSLCESVCVMHPHLLLDGSLVSQPRVISQRLSRMSDGMLCHGARILVASASLWALDDPLAVPSECVILSRASTILSTTSLSFFALSCFHQLPNVGGAPIDLCLALQNSGSTSENKLCGLLLGLMCLRSELQ